MKKFYFKCPRCQGDDDFHKLSEQPTATGCALFIFGGFIPALIYGMHKTGRIQCAKCSYIFKQPSLPTSPLSKMSGWIFFVILISIAIMVLLNFMPELGNELTNIYLRDICVEFIKSNPLGVAAGMIVMITGILIIITFTSIISNYLVRNKLKKKYLVFPGQYKIPNVGTHNADKPAKNPSGDQ